MHKAAEPNLVIVSAADTGYFRLLQGLVRSIRDQPQGKSLPIRVFDLGLAPADRDWLAGQAVAVVAPDWDVDFPRREKMPEVFKAQVARPFLTRYFPGFDLYVWIDADAWVQDWSAIETLRRVAESGHLAICPEIDRSYKRHYKRPKLFGMTLQWKCYRKAFGWRTADRLGRNPMLNCGVFAMRVDSPGWRIWAETMTRALQRSTFILEQIALNHAVFTGALKASFLPATYNWLCGDAAPMWDPERRKFVEPNAPYAALGILHLAGEGQKEKRFRIATTTGGSVETTLRYGDFPGSAIPPE